MGRKFMGRISKVSFFFIFFFYFYCLVNSHPVPTFGSMSYSRDSDPLKLEGKYENFIF
jgi:hypothetical protein